MPQIAQIAATYASQIFWLLLTFGILYFGIGKGMVPKIVSTVDAREGRIAGDLAAAVAARAQADTVQATWQAEMDAARVAAQAETAAAAKRAAMAFEQQVHAADADIAERLGHHDLAVANAKAQALANLQNVAAEAAQQLADKVAGLQVSLDSASDAVRRTMAHG
ncbi:ATP synthase subunit b [Sphingomonas sp. T1]|jgi:F-type H+-transporting ATPase subunit b|uniref:F0F1 ATP synthase subunit B family protein n=1 Tax=unclassified Sphingomonas TaxID=196159 RepID=UPI0007008280|nr:MULTISPECIES: ATPase [unclassified Sphingomonas]KQN14469.1 ATPase [Sphingomonas sp. Leaf30]MBD8468968.1 ATPase [Sphingomonas sp. CFBP 8765]MBD8550208.1 ATPase [Sphingomonas sp. CFBP 8764]MBD8737331.1 ATPase [Sphingomonas sp. CFBP 13706]VXC61608.1 ATP synthase subunit b [Sphingomonas sp. T1]